MLRILASRKRFPLVTRILRRRITLSVSEGTVWPEPRPLADAEGYSGYALEGRSGLRLRFLNPRDTGLDIWKRPVRKVRLN